jgi:hypothetical protein
LKIPKGHSEDVNRRRIDNTMAKRKKDKRTNNYLQDIKQETTDRATRNPLKMGGERGWSGRVSSSCYTLLQTRAQILGFS